MSRTRLNVNPSREKPRPHFHVALNLPHAGRVCRRIAQLLPPHTSDVSVEADAAHRLVFELVELLDPCLDAGENPPGPAGARLREQAAALGRKLTEHIERGGLGHDRLGQCVRNLFECLELGIEGAEISLRAGENPNSLQRPV